MAHHPNLHIICDLHSAVWAGAKLADVLELVGIPKLSSSTPSGGKHVEFVSIDRCKVMALYLLWSISFAALAASYS